MSKIKQSLNEIGFNFDNLDQEALEKKWKFSNKVRVFKSEVKQIANIWRYFDTAKSKEGRENIKETKEKLRDKCIKLGIEARDSGYDELRNELADIYIKLK